MTGHILLDLDLGETVAVLQKKLIAAGAKTRSTLHVTRNQTLLLRALVGKVDRAGQPPRQHRTGARGIKAQAREAREQHEGELPEIVKLWQYEETLWFNGSPS